jgi:peptidoglycan hydrolase CwlO-like protein
MEQYTNTGSADTPVTPAKATPETKSIQSLESKITTLENFVHDQGREMLKLRRDIGRLKADIEQLASVLKNRG